MRRALTAVFAEKRKLTADLGGAAKTTEFTEALVAAIAAEA